MLKQERNSKLKIYQRCNSYFTPNPCLDMLESFYGRCNFHDMYFKSIAAFRNSVFKCQLLLATKGDFAKRKPTSH